ncbi:MAG: hypothetical protein PSV22_14320 [Pseudolabrys sp.]|nr:hypothetical protein [Pseudolabrys sp.]
MPEIEEIVTGVEVIEVVTAGPQGPAGSGGGGGGWLDDLAPSPAGTFPFATVTLDVKGRTLSATAGTDVASESTQQSMQNDITLILSAVNGLATNGLTGNTVTEEA